MDNGISQTTSSEENQAGSVRGSGGHFPVCVCVCALRKASPVRCLLISGLSVCSGSTRTSVAGCHVLLQLVDLR